MIPLNEKATIVKSAGLDDWGEKVPGAESVLPCTLKYKTKVVTDVNGAEVVTKGEFLFRGNAGITYSDTLKFTDELEVGQEVKPVLIQFKKDLSATVLFTKVVF